MCEAKWLFKAVVIGLIVKSCHLISSGSNGTAEILWKLSHHALEGKQQEISSRQAGYGLVQSGNHQRPYNYQQNYPENYPQNYRPNFGPYEQIGGQNQQNLGLHHPVNYPQNGLGYYAPNGAQKYPPYYSQSGGYYPPNGGNYPPNGENYPPNYQYQNAPYAPGYQNPQSIMSALSSIAQNDELHCVPKLLCELTSGSRSVSGKQSSFLPFNINMESLLGLLSAFNGAGNSPLLLFGRAALLGYTSSGNSAPCTYSFPQCPNDPNKLVNYLNNYNGGFFRYFNGLPRPGHYQAQQRILTKPYQLAEGYRIRFPADYTPNDIKDGFYKYKSGKTLTFPGETAFTGQYHFRRPKTLSFPVNNVLDFQKPLPNHIASPTIFPTRTGTGELILDNDAFDYDYHRNYFYNRHT